MLQGAFKEGIDGAVLAMDATGLHIISPVQDALQACVLKYTPYIHTLQGRHIPYVRSGKPYTPYTLRRIPANTSKQWQAVKIATIAGIL